MVIYKDYTTEDLLLDKPCYVERLGNIYPIHVKDYKEFQKYAQYLVFSKKHLNLNEDYKLLDTLIMSIAVSRCDNAQDNEKIGKAMLEVLSEVAALISMITKDKISFDIVGGSYVFGNEDSSIFVNRYNFDDFRNIILKQNLLKEPKIFEDKLTQKWYEKALKGRQKNAPKINFEDIIITVSQDMKMKIEEMKEMNIFQLYYYYYRIVHIENYRAVTIFRTCSDKLPNINYSDGLLDTLYKDSDDDIFIDTNSIATKL